MNPAFQVRDDVDDIVMTPFPVERMVLGIVGSTVFADDGHRQVLPRVHATIGCAIGQYRPDAIVSGGAAGVDTLARTIAEYFGYEPQRSVGYQRPEAGTVHEFIPRHNRWGGPDGFKARNLVIAQTVTHLLCIRSADSGTYGSGWTADRVEEMGKPVMRVMLPSALPTVWPGW